MNPRWRHHLYQAPELALLPVLDRCLDALSLVLEFEHPTVDEPRVRSDPPTLHHARRLRYAANRLRRELRAYRDAEARLLQVSVDDLPF